MVAVTPIVIGNWKMNGLQAAVSELEALETAFKAQAPACEVMLCPPATLIAAFAGRAQGTPVLIGGQDCHFNVSGAHTGDISAQMLADAGAKAVIVGHSERRTDHEETDDTVRVKAEAALACALTAIICVGETEAQRDAEATLDVLTAQLTDSVPDGAAAATVIVAYEPVWAIGTGRTPTTSQIAEAHGHIRRVLTDRFGSEGEKMRLLYGGSVKPGNAAEIFAVPHVNGGLIGGASLKATDFEVIVRAIPA